MKLKKVTYQPSDFLRIRDFLKETYANNKHHNWGIDRWNFCRFVSQNFHDTFNNWPDTVGIWVDDNERIQCVVNSEGENRGEVFFQMRGLDYSDKAYDAFITHAEEKYLAINDEGQNFIQLRVDPNNHPLKEILDQRGYKPLKLHEINLSLKVLNPFNYQIPKGLTLVDGHEITATQKAVAHAKAFGYYENTDFPIEIPIKAFEALTQAPDYMKALDMAIINDQKEIVSFCTLWFDDYNKIAILEPVGTIPNYRRQGLSKNCIFAGINRAYDLGARKIFVGSNQEFYHKIGFRFDYQIEIWKKIWTNN